MRGAGGTRDWAPVLIPEPQTTHATNATPEDSVADSGIYAGSEPESSSSDSVSPSDSDPEPDDNEQEEFPGPADTATLGV